MYGGEKIIIFFLTQLPKAKQRGKSTSFELIAVQTSNFKISNLSSAFEDPTARR